MKLKQSIRYQLADYIGPVIIYYGIVLALYALYYAACVFAWANMNFSGGLSSCTAIFLFICGLCSFHDNLPMHLQNGVSRNTMFQGRLAVTGITCGVMALADTVLGTILDAIPFYVRYAQTYYRYTGSSRFSLLHTLFHSSETGEPLYGGVGGLLLSLVFNFALLLLASCLGYFIIVFFYRLPVKLRIVAGACAGFVLFFGVPGVKIIDTNLLGEGLRAFFSRHVEPVLEFIWENPFALMGTWAVAAVVLSALSWLLMRRTAVAR